MKKLLIATAVLEVATGASLLTAPSFIARLLLGAGLESPVAVLLGKVAGAALLSIGLACWVDRNRSGRGPLGLVTGLAAYNAMGAVLLARGAIVDGMDGVAIWPACAVHLALLIWCARCLVSTGTAGETPAEGSR